MKTSVRGTYINGKSIYEIYFSKTLAEVMKENQNAIQKNQRRSLYGLYYPFYSYGDQQYLLFMTNIFAKLEIRQFLPNEYLARELETSTEILFIDQGNYRYGFNINNEEYLKLTFGPSTRIGIYNLLY